MTGLRKRNNRGHLSHENFVQVKQSHAFLTSSFVGCLNWTIGPEIDTSNFGVL